MVVFSRRKVLRRLVRKDCLAPEAAAEMLRWEHTGFSLHNDVTVAAQDRAGLERLVSSR